ncbi:MAG: peptidylprolyl isomerase [Planctomycetia bacterium]|jgi:peptidyl-prolyl cis-trans isomerase A (cyclophilin A)
MRTILPALRVALLLLAPCLCLTTEPAGAETIRPVVRFTINGQYSMDVELFSDLVPETVQNFLAYVADNTYTNTIIHRSTTYNYVLDPNSGGRIPTSPWILQGGGYGPVSTSPLTMGAVQTFDPIALQAGIPNVRGTIAMARLGDDPVPNPDSATSGFFFNVTDNSSVFDPLIDQSTGDVTRYGYAVFGRIVEGVLPPLHPTLHGYELLNALAFLDVSNTSPQFPVPPFGEMPLIGYSAQPVVAENLVYVTSIAPVPEPSTLVLAGVGLAVAAVAARRRI